MLSPALRTTVRRSGQGLRVILNGRSTIIPPMRYLLDRLDSLPLEIRMTSQARLGRGYAMSAATTTSLALALASSGVCSWEYALQLAHQAEVVSRTGLGDVQAVATGGQLVVREVHGAPGIGRSYSLPVEGGISFVGVETGTMQTKDMLSIYWDRIMRYGSTYVRKFLREPSFERFVELSERFSRDVGFLRSEHLEAIKSIRWAIAGVAAKKSLLFLLVERDEISEVSSFLRSKFGNVSVFEIGGGIWRERRSIEVIRGIGL